jgi:hypothetical protein
LHPGQRAELYVLDAETARGCLPWEGGAAERVTGAGPGLSPSNRSSPAAGRARWSRSRGLTGTINVASWAPDGRRLACVAYPFAGPEGMRDRYTQVIHTQLTAL